MCWNFRCQFWAHHIKTCNARFHYTHTHQRKIISFNIKVSQKQYKAFLIIQHITISVQIPFRLNSIKVMKKIFFLRYCSTVFVLLFGTQYSDQVWSWRSNCFIFILLKLVVMVDHKLCWRSVDQTWKKTDILKIIKN